MLIVTAAAAVRLGSQAHLAHGATPERGDGGARDVAADEAVDGSDADATLASPGPDGGANAGPDGSPAPAPPSTAPAAATSGAPPVGQPPRPAAVSPLADEPIVDVVVTGTRTPERSQRAAVKTDVVTKQEAEQRGATNVAEALATQPGVQVNPGAYGHLGYVSPIQIQGFDLGRVLILEDGEPVTGDVGSGIDLAGIPLADVDRIEIVTGPTSALYGSSAIGGVVNIISAPPRREGTGGRARAEGRSYRGLVLQATGTQRRGTTWGALDLGLTRQDGVPAVPGEPDLQIPRTARTLVGIRSGARLAHRVDLQIRGRWLRDEVDGLASRTYPGLGVYLIDTPSTTNRFALHALGTIRWGPGSSLRLSLAGQRADDTASTRPRGSPLGETRDTSQGLGSFEATASVADGPRTWVAGTRLDLQQARQELRRTEDVGGVPVTSIEEQLAPRQLSSAALYGQLQWKIGDRLQVLPGLRAERHEQFGSVLAPRLAIALRPTPSLLLRASAGRGFRAPSAKELGFNFDHSIYGYRVVGNPALSPERSWGANADASWDVKPPLTLRCGGFANRVTDLIDTDLAGGSSGGTVVTYTYANFARVRTLGGQASVTVQIAGRVRADAAYDYLWTRNDVTGAPLAGRPAHTVTASAQVQLPAKVQLYARTRLASDAYVDTDTRSPGYATVDVRVGRPLWAGALAYLGVLNAGDVHQEPGRVGDLRPPQGRVFYLGVRAELPTEGP